MAHIQTNINNFYSKLQEFWNTERYTDVTIECGDRNFKCHKLALATTCEYFDSMFGGFFKEKTMEIITLKDIAAETFEQVLKFIYTGDLVVNSNNVTSLLQASGFFNLPGIGDLCIQFLEKNKVTSQNVFDVFALACLTKKNTLINMCACYFRRWFEILSNDERFYEIPFDGLKIILTEFSKLPKKNENSLLNGITQWIQYDRPSRFMYCDELFGMINFKNISSSKIQFMRANINLFTRRIEPLNQNTASTCDNSSGYPEIGLHLFVNDYKRNMKRILSMNDNCFCRAVHVTLQNKRIWTRCVAVGGSYLYKFSFLSDSSNLEMDTAWVHKFCVYSSIDMCSEIELRPAPIELYGLGTALCTIENNIYLYHPYASSISNGRELCIKTKSSNSFNDEEVRRGIYSYNCETDAWFSMPKMKKTLNRSCMSVCRDTLYIIGGFSNNPQELGIAGYVQACDPREGIWRELPRSNGVYYAAASCAIDDKVYVCDGLGDSGIQLERYDVTAGKWEILAPMNISLNFYRAIPYLNQLWVMGHRGLNYFENPVVRVYDPDTNGWRNFEATFEEIVQCGCIMDAVVFKSW